MSVEIFVTESKWMFKEEALKKLQDGGFEVHDCMADIVETQVIDLENYRQRKAIKNVQPR